MTFFMSTKFLKNIVSKLRLAWIMAEIKPYSFQPYDMLEIHAWEDDVRESQDDCQRGNTTCCLCEYCANWEGQ